MRDLCAGVLDKEEFASGWESIWDELTELHNYSTLSDQNIGKHLEAIFEAVDANKDGSISLNEVR